MSQTKTTQDLLIVAIQDLYDGALAWTERFEKLRKATSYGPLTEFVSVCGRKAKAVCRDLEKLARSFDAEPKSSDNLWLRAELDDAERDSETIIAGPLRDIALVGAFRKAKQSERVSYETALVLARRLRLRDAAAHLMAMRDDAARADAALARQLRELVSTLPG